MDEAEAKAKGLLQIIGNKEVDDDYIAQVKTLSVQPELIENRGQGAEDRLYADSRLRQQACPPHPQGNRH